MNKRVKKLWIAALRSGKYRKTTQRLRRKQGDGEFGYCCLGVLSELFRQEHPRSGEWLEESTFRSTRNTADSSETTLPRCVQKWSGVPDANPDVGRMMNLARLNDSGKSFDHIADRIEKYL